MTTRLREALAELGESMPTARLTPDVWRRGRQARRRGLLMRSVVAGLAILLVALALPWAVSRSQPAPWTPADGGDAVPAKLHLPWMWQATVQMDPPGAASVLFGGDSIGLHGTDLFDSEGKLAVVGRRGDYRMLLYSGMDSIAAGESALLSPDGSRVAQEFLEGSGLNQNAGLVIIDLTTGESEGYGMTREGICCGPVAWAPDGGSLVVDILGDDLIYDQYTGIGMRPRRLALLDLATGSLTPLSEYRPAQNVRTASRAAFSPDGQLIALTEGNTVRLVDRTGSVRWSTDLGDRTHLAGVGAFTRDGAQIATVTLDGCLNECDRAALAARRWSVGFLDTRTGTPTAGPRLEPVTGMAIRALGWSQGRDLVILRYEPEQDARKTRNREWNDTGWSETGHVTLVALAPDGSTRVLIDPPDSVLTMDVAHDLLEAGRFGGPSPTAAMFPARRIILVAVVPVAGLLLVAGMLVALLVHCRRSQRAATRSSRN